MLTTLLEEIWIKNVLDDTHTSNCINTSSQISTVPQSNAAMDVSLFRHETLSPCSMASMVPCEDPSQISIHDSQRASIYHQETEANLLELSRFITLHGLGSPDSPNTTSWPPLVFQGLAPMDQLSKSRTKTNLQTKYRSPQMPLAARHWFSQGSKSRSQ